MIVLVHQCFVDHSLQSHVVGSYGLISIIYIYIFLNKNIFNECIHPYNTTLKILLCRQHFVLAQLEGKS